MDIKPVKRQRPPKVNQDDPSSGKLIQVRKYTFMISKTFFKVKLSFPPKFHQLNFMEVEVRSQWLTIHQTQMIKASEDSEISTAIGLNNSNSFHLVIKNKL